MNIVAVISSSIINKVRKVKFLRMGRSDVRECKESMPFGLDSSPIKGMRAIFAPTPTGEDIVIGYLNVQQLAKPGETRLFSVDENGSLKTSIYLKNDGTIEFGGSSGNLTRYQELKSGYDELKGDLNKLISAFNTHVHPTAATGPPSVPTPVPNVIPASPSTADISGAKIEEFKTP